jgi:hypothetical protein
MAWFKVDDGLPEHRKVRALGRQRVAAMGLWTLCGAWAARNLTDGFVPDEVVKRHDPRGLLAGKLQESGLWVAANVHGERGYQFHDWGQANPTRAEVEARREDTRKRVAKHRTRRNAGTEGEPGPPTPPDGIPAGNALLTALVTDDVLTGARARAQASRPGPARPDPSPSGETWGGGVPDSTAPSAPPAPRLDASNPRCGRHAHIPAADPGPNCRGCRDVRLSLEQTTPADSRAAERAAFRAAVDACSRCDDRGMLELDDGTPARCDHRPPLRAVGT